MKSEDLFDGVTDIRDDLVDGAKRKRKTKSVWRGAVAAVLVLAIAAGGFAILRDTSGAPEAPGSPYPGDEPTDESVELLVRVEYPDRPQYPETKNGIDYNEKDYDKWVEDNRLRRLSTDERERITNFTKTALPAFFGSSGDGNSVISPANIYLTLAMLAETTAGESQRQILDLLDLPADSLTEAAGRLWDALYNADGTYKSEASCSLWLRDDWDYSQQTVDELASNLRAYVYRGKMGSAGMDRALHDWLNGHTGGLLDDSAGGISLPEDTAIALAGTLYFSDMWGSQFDPAETTAMTFHARNGDVERDFMRKTFRELSYYWTDNFAAVSIRFESGGEMRLILPDEGVSPEELASDETALAFLTYYGEIPEGVEQKSLRVHLRLPKFDVAGEADLSGALSALGVKDIFDMGEADFSRIVPESSVPVWVSSVLHGARVKVDEEGCEAAAYTLIIAPGAAPPPDDEVEITFDRPFIFSITQNGLPLFAGIVNEP